MRLPHRLRLLLATRPLVYWGLTIALAGGTALVVQRATADAAAARHRWGETRATLVTTRAVAIGEILGPGNAEIRAMPIGLRPDGALEALPGAAETAPAVAAPLGAGEIVTAARVGRPGRSELAGLLPEHRRGVAVAVPDGLPLRPGDTVDVIGAAGVVAAGASVVRVTEDVAVVAVDEADSAGVAGAAADGEAVLVLSP